MHCVFNYVRFCYKDMEHKKLENKRSLYSTILIHSFALAHAFVVVLFRHFNLADEIPLTILTVLMIVLVTQLYKFPYDLTAVMALLFCFAGFFIGTKGGEWIMNNSSGWIKNNANVVVSFLVTEFDGWVTYFVVRSIHFTSFDSE